MKELIVKLYNEGKSYREIEKITKVGRGTISYYLNPNTPIKKVIQRKKRRLIIKKRCIEEKGGKCQLCGYNSIVSALEFHHLSPQSKDSCISQLISRNQAFETIKPELDKCILVCANCHRGIHSGEIIINI